MLCSIRLYYSASLTILLWQTLLFWNIFWHLVVIFDFVVYNHRLYAKCHFDFHLKIGRTKPFEFALTFNMIDIWFKLSELLFVNDIWYEAMTFSNWRTVDVWLIYNSNKCCNYRQIIKRFNLQFYLTKYIPYLFRKALFKMSLSSHTLSVEISWA